MPTPSLLIVPARFKTGRLYSQIPVPVAPSTSSVGDFNVTRNTTATRFGPDGLIASVASGIPRLDYYTSGGTAGCPALLVEPAATNLVLHSRDLTNAVWSGTNVTRVKNAVGADGVASGATTLTATAASGTVLQALSHASQSRVFSAYVRRVTGTGAIQMTTNNGTTWTTVTISSLYTQVACAAQTVASGTVGFRMAVSGDVIEVDFTQGEVGPVATSPIVNAAASGSRSADVISVSGAVSGSIGQTEGTIYCEFEFPNTDKGDVIRIDSGSDANVVEFVSVNTPNQRARIKGSSAPFINLVANPANMAINTRFKIAIGYKTGDSALYINGISQSTDATAFTFNAALTTITLGPDIAWGRRVVRIFAAALYTTRLTNAELQALTA